MTTAEILRAARERISDTSRWCQEVYAVDASGEPCAATDAAAVRWCLYGAIRRAMKREVIVPTPPPVSIIWDAASDLYLRRPAEVNDDLGHEAALRVLDRAIEMAEAEAVPQ